MIFVLRDSPGGLDAFGNPVEGTSVRFGLPDAHVAPRTSADVGGRGRDGVVDGLTLFASVDADVRDTDRIEVDGQVWHVEGTVGRWRSPFGSDVDGLSVALKRGQG